MNADDFAIRLKELAPAKSKLLEYHSSPEEADLFLESFECLPRSEPLGIESNGDSMLELINKWDMSGVVIGPISFHESPEWFDSHMEIGTVEGDRIVYRFETRDYVLLDWQNLSHVMCEVALKGSTFLDGLYEICRWFAKNAIYEIDLDDEKTGAEIKSNCIAAFGGSRYEVFCTTVLGF